MILDATFSAHRWRAAAADLARAAGARFVLVEARCADRDRLRARLAARRRAPAVSDATDAELDELLRRYEPLTSADPEPRLSIDTASDPAVSLERALRRAARPGRASGAASGWRPDSAHFLRAAWIGAHSLRQRPPVSPDLSRPCAGAAIAQPVAMETKSPRKILVATDFSEGSDDAIDRAIEMAKQSGAAVEIIHVVELAEEFPFGTAYFDGGLRRALRQRRPRSFRAAPTGSGQRGSRAKPRSSTGTPPPRSRHAVATSAPT